MSNAGDPYFQNKSYGYITAARKWNVNVELYDAGGYENSTKQISQMEDAIQRHVDAIILTATNGAALVPGVNEAVQAHIPVVNDDVLVNSNKVNVKDSENSVNVGYHEAYYIACKMGGKGDVVMLKGPAGADIAIARVKGAMMAFRQFPSIHIVAQQWAPSNIVAATNLMDDFLQAHHNIGGVYSFGAVTALGAAQALKSAGYKPGTKRWPVIATIDLHAQSIAAMQQKEFQAVIPAEPVRLAETSVVLAIKLAEHQSVPKRVYTDSEIPLALSNLKHFNMSLALAPKGWKPPIH
jgi:ABC-type sugar transport system substrate-binding protein